MKLILNLIILFILCTGCDQKTNSGIQNWEQLNGRDSSEERLIIRRPVYRMRIPKHWKRIDPPSDSSIVDTTLPLVEYRIGDEIHITIHNFPFKDLKQRIPPRAQVARWQRQLSNLPTKEAIIEPISHSGFAGLYFEGTLDDQQVMAWALQLDAEHIRSLSRQTDETNRTYIEQMQADVTIKVVGPPKLCEYYREEIIATAGSFELIQEIPRLP